MADPVVSPSLSTKMQQVLLRLSSLRTAALTLADKFLSSILDRSQMAVHHNEAVTETTLIAIAYSVVISVSAPLKTP